MPGTQKFVILDRDGVINRAIVREGIPYPPIDAKETEILPGVVSSLTLLKTAGFLLIVVSNQPDVARGTTTRKAVEAINAKLANRLPLFDFRVCYHDNRDRCECRKPKPGMILAAALDYKIDLSQSFMVGDRWRDIEAGKRSGCKTVFIDYSYNEPQPKNFDYRVQTLADAVHIILAENRRAP